MCSVADTVLLQAIPKLHILAHLPLLLYANRSLKLLSAEEGASNWGLLKTADHTLTTLALLGEAAHKVDSKGNYLRTNKHAATFADQVASQ